MLEQLKVARNEYPRQFWLLFAGMLISTIGSSMIWPFLMIYVSERLKLPLATVAGLMTISAAAGIISSFIAGPIIDRVGRKWAMALSLLLNGVGYLFMSHAGTLGQFAVLMACTGAVNPIYRVAADAMMADLIPPEKRIDAYSLMRMSNNVGVALGPSIGGFIASASYGLAFYFAAAGLGAYSLLVTLFAAETLPARTGGQASPHVSARKAERFGGYATIAADRPFMGMVGAFTLAQICAALIWVLMSVYAKQNFGVPERLYGLMPTTNAVMVVCFQILVTRITKRHPPLKMMALGAAIYAVAVGGVALASGFWGFWVATVVMTVGELIIVPTSSTYVANLAPPDMRGRYMSLYGLGWPVASGIGPVLGGLANDNLGPRFIWIGGGLIGLCSAVGYAFLARHAAPPAERAARALRPEA